jgi:hypothetical protein
MNKLKIIMYVCAANLLVGCSPYSGAIGIMGICQAVNQLKIESLKYEIGSEKFFEIRAKVQTREGVQEKKEWVKAKIVGHEVFAGGVIRIYESTYQNDEKIVFKNAEGRILVIPSEHPSSLGRDYDGALDILIGGYVDGKHVSTKELRKEDSLRKNGFRLLSYVAPEIK